MATEQIWSAPEALPAMQPVDCDPALAVVSEVPHLVWTRDNMLYHSYRSSDGWLSPMHVTGGSQPAVVGGRDGHLHCLFANEFMGNWEIYHMAWDGSAATMPVNVSHSMGKSSNPALAIAADGVLHATWADDTPSRPVIYYGRREEPFWSANPLPGVTGYLPTIAVGTRGEVYVAWQDCTSGGHSEIYCSILDPESGTWSIPENVSASDGESHWPCLVNGPSGACHLLWQESDPSERIYYANRRPGGWSQPEPVSSENTGCLAPHAAVNPENYLQAAWFEGDLLIHRVRPPGDEAAWRAPETIAGPLTGARQSAIAVSQRGKLHLVWALPGDGPQGAPFYYARREPLFKSSSFMPLLARSERRAARRVARTGGQA